MKNTYKYIIVVLQIIVLLVIMGMFIKTGYYVDENNTTGKFNKKINSRNTHK